MAQFDFLQDDDARAVIAQLAAEAARVWAPDEAGLADLIAEEYLDQVQEADQLLYAAPTRELSLGIGDADLWLLIILPVATGFLANLLAAFSAWSLHSLRQRLASQSSPTQTAAGSLPSSQVRQLLEPQARLAGLSEAQIDQLAALFAAGLSAILLAGGNGGGAV